MIKGMFRLVPFQDDELPVLTKTISNYIMVIFPHRKGVPYTSPDGKIYSESGSLLNTLLAATMAQQIDNVKLFTLISFAH